MIHRQFCHVSVILVSTAQHTFHLVASNTCGHPAHALNHPRSSFSQYPEHTHTSPPPTHCH
eukprot:m.3014 g.3014  ORF g.3014 m.3014 type:complete len:61 (+) comp3600_c0_seq1:29-211(+)